MALSEPSTSLQAIRTSNLGPLSLSRGAAVLGPVINNIDLLSQIPLMMSGVSTALSQAKGQAEHCQLHVLSVTA